MGGGGFLGGILGGVLGLAGGLIGGQKQQKPVYQQPKPVASAEPGKSDEPEKSASQIVADEEDARRKRLLALNAGGAGGQLTQAGGDTSMAPVSRKTLLGQ